MKGSDFPKQQESPDDFSSALYQRTEELYQVPSAEADENGMIECAVLILRDMVVFPRMVSPIFIVPGPNLVAIQETQYNFETMVALILRDPDVENPKPEHLLDVGVEVAVGRMLSLPDGNSSALI